MKSAFFTIIIALAATLSSAAQAVRPADLKFPPLKYSPPAPGQYRHVLDQGLRAYLAADSSLPLVNISAIVRYGVLNESADKLGLSRLMQETLVKGGTAGKEGAALEERLDFLGATLNYRVEERFSTLSMTLLSKDLDEGLDLFFDVLRRPEFRDESLKVARGRVLEELRQVNDSPRPVVEREFERLVYGDHPLTAFPTRKTVTAVTREDLKAAHARFFFPANVVLLIAGDFQPEPLKAKVNAQISGWPNPPAEEIAFPAVKASAEPGVYFIQKAINQGYVNLGHLGIDLDCPDFFDVQVMNFILGGGSFTSRITTKVRSDEGLAYNTGSRFTFHPGFPGIFAGYVQTKSATTGYAIDLIKKEFERIRQGGVTAAEMETARNYYLESLSEQFSTPMATLNSLALLELQGRPADYYQTYQDRVRRVTRESVQAAARKYIQPDKLIICVVGDFPACNASSDKFPHPLDFFGKITMVPLVDRMTGEAVK